MHFVHGKTIMKWTQDQAIAFECAREVITHLMAIQTGRIADESHKKNPDSELLETFRAERSALHLDQTNAIARIRKEYGAVIRSWRDQYHAA